MCTFIHSFTDSCFQSFFAVVNNAAVNVCSLTAQEWTSWVVCLFTFRGTFVLIIIVVALL